ncbi:unnamed protein product [Kuraishia capsulata CBS 1993]|uniref:Interferon-related developmental regulator N-terminal domain-containing protein n=1 Tax=Kuraishia capsulata CBS 1993 TaxID=1382522 RepID=W6MKQ0_9ASCO|nr:uncharacterized protein KUCA_T00001296001 [Kuraishia capsulata CBS 1993]CDK25327.1 unnamed protein product [Kuraishia capsulata CBS 1993]
MSDLQRILQSPRSMNRSHSKASVRSASQTPLGYASDNSEDVDEDDWNYGKIDDLIISKIASLNDDDGESASRNGSQVNLSDPLKFLKTHTIDEIITSLSLPRTQVSSASRELLLAQMYHLIIKSPLPIDGVAVNERNTELLVDFWKDARSENERLFAFRCVVAYASSDIDEVASVVISDFLPYVLNDLTPKDNEDGAVSVTLRSNYIIGYCALSLVAMDGSGCNGVEDIVTMLIDLAEGYDASSELNAEDVASAALQGAGVLISLIFKGRSTTRGLDELIQDVCPRVVVFLEAGHHIITQKAAGKLVALMYELFDFQDDIEKDDNEDYGDEEELSPYFDVSEVLSLVKELATLSSKKVSKKEKKESHSLFRDVLRTVETHASKTDRLAEQNSLEEPSVLSHLKISKSKSLSITSWYSYLRLVHLRWIFSSGLHSQLANSSESGIKDLIDFPEQSKYQFSRNIEEDSGIGEREFTTKSKAVNSKTRTKEINSAREDKLRETLETLNVTDGDIVLSH